VIPLQCSNLVGSNLPFQWATLGERMLTGSCKYRFKEGQC